MVTAIRHALFSSLAGALLGAGLWVGAGHLGLVPPAEEDLPAVGLAALGEGLPAGQPLPNLADLIQERCEKLLEQVCMPILP